MQNSKFRHIKGFQALAKVIKIRMKFRLWVELSLVHSETDLSGSEDASELGFLTDGMTLYYIGVFRLLQSRPIPSNYHHRGLTKLFFSSLKRRRKHLKTQTLSTTAELWVQQNSLDSQQTLVTSQSSLNSLCSHGSTCELTEIWLSTQEDSNEVNAEGTKPGVFPFKWKGFMLR